MNVHKGFTLIEVLIALVILSVSLTAIVKASSTDIINTHYLITKSQAHLVAVEAANLIQLGSIAFANNKAENKTRLSDKDWYWIATKKETKTRDLYKLTLTVFLHHKEIITEELYLLQFKTPQ